MKSTHHDSKLFNESFNGIINNIDISKNFNNSTTILADKGYDSKTIRERIKSSKMKCIIAHNKEIISLLAKANNLARLCCKDKSKIKSFCKRKNIYKKKVEHFLGIIKRYPKINCIYEKSLHSYLNLLLLLSSMIVISLHSIINYII